MSDITFLELQQEVANMCKMDLTDATNLAMIKRWINIAQEDVNSRASWPWLESREIVQTVVEKTDGTIAVATGATSVTGTSTAFASTDVGSFIQFSNANDWYKITAVTSTTDLTIESPFAGSSSLTVGTYTIRKVFYSLSSSADKVLSCRQAISPIKLTTFHWRAIDQYKPDITATGNPEVCFMFGIDSSRNWQFCTYPIADAIINLEFRIKLRSVDLSADASVSSIPSKWAKTVLLSGAIWRGMEYSRISGETARSDKWLQIYEAGINRMYNEELVSEDYHGIIQSNECRVRGIEIRFPESYDISK